jgi:hypothetical protein
MKIILYFAELLFKVSAWFSNHAVCKIGLKLDCRIEPSRELRSVVGGG